MNLGNRLSLPEEKYWSFTDWKEIEIEGKGDRVKGRDWWQEWDGGKEIIFCNGEMVYYNNGEMLCDILLLEHSSVAYLNFSYGKIIRLVIVFHSNIFKNFF